jgi:hypothetical protein
MQRYILSENTFFGVTSKGETLRIQLTDEQLLGIEPLLYQKDSTELEEYLRNLINPREVYNNLLTIPGFIRKGDSLYYEGIPIPIPGDLADDLLNAYETGNTDALEGLTRFWCWLVQVPNPLIREQAFAWGRQYKAQITRGGLYLLYRQVWKRGGNSDYTNYISATYASLRRKKKTTDREVWRWTIKGDVYYSVTPPDEETMGMVDANSLKALGSLKKLYLGLKEEEDAWYTDDYSKECVFRIGVEARMEPSSADLVSMMACSEGYHSQVGTWTHTHGDTWLLITVNPKDLISLGAGGAKIRSLAFTPIAVIEDVKDWTQEKDVWDLLEAQFDAQVEAMDELKHKALVEEYWKQREGVYGESEIVFGNIIDSSVSVDYIKQLLRGEG